MKAINYIFALVFIISYSKIASMKNEENYHQIKEVGKSADIKGAQELLDSGMNINEQGTLGYSMLIHAVSYMYETKDNKIPREQRLVFIKFLIKKGAELQPKTDDWKKVPILHACTSAIAPEIIELFIENGVNINTTHLSNGANALHIAAWHGNARLVTYLLNQKNIQINRKDVEDRTPLIRAAVWCHAKVVKELLKHGADIRIKDCSGRTALDYALRSSTEEHKKSQTIKYLMLKMMDSKGKDLDENVDTLFKSVT